MGMNAVSDMSQDWMQFNTDCTPLDIQHYVKTHPIKADVDVYQHMAGLQETVRAD